MYYISYKQKMTQRAEGPWVESWSTNQRKLLLSFETDEIYLSGFQHCLKLSKW
jgi:hypothetical protein